jgi:3-oxoacyl-[acyl-carrier protein] reductase
MRLKNKVALVTGGSRGIGRSICIEIAKNGADIVLTYIKDKDAADQLVDEIVKMGRKAMAIQADAADYLKAQEIVAIIKERFGRLDILVNNAGTIADAPLFMLTENAWDQVINTNLKSVFNYSKAVIVTFLKQEAGCIINISSVSGMGGVAGQSNYCASKAGIINFTKSVAKEVAKKNVRINSISPGYVKTDMITQINEKRNNELLAAIPMQRVADPEDISKVVVFLATDDANYITGQNIVIDGGMSF